MRVCGMERTRSPVVRMPTRLRGSAALITITCASCAVRRISRIFSTASASANCSPETPVTKRPPRVWPRASGGGGTRGGSGHAGGVVAPWRGVRLAGEEAAEDDSVAAEERPGLRVEVGLVLREDRPAAGAAGDEA